MGVSPLFELLRMRTCLVPKGCLLISLLSSPLSPLPRWRVVSLRDGFGLHLRASCILFIFREDDEFLGLSLCIHIAGKWKV